MTEEVNASRLVDSTRTRGLPGNATSASSIMTPQCERAASAKPSIRMLTILTIGNARAVSRTLPIVICASSAKRPIQMANHSEVVVKASAVAILEAGNSQQIGIALVAE